MFDVFKIKDWLKKNFTKIDFLIIVFLLCLFFFTRLINLTTNYPIFTDEGIYIHWAKVAWHDASWRFISLTDGRQPLQTWATIPFLKLFPENLLYGARLFGVFSGLFGLLGIFFTAFYLFNKRIAYFSSLLYISTPFYIFFDRIAMIDTFVSAAFIWMFLLSIIFVRNLSIGMSVIFGMITGLFLLAKSTISLFLGLSFFSILFLFDKKIEIKKAVNFSILYVLSTLIAFLIYNIQRLSPYMHFIGQKNNTFILTFAEFLKNPFQLVAINIVNVPLFTAHNLGYTTFIFGILGLFYLCKKNWKIGLYVILWLAIPYGIITFFNRVLYTRYIIFLLPLLIIAAAYFFDLYLFKVKNKFFLILFLLLAYLFSFYYSYTVMYDWKNIPFVKDDRGQYIEDWPAGYGAQEIIDFAREKSKIKDVVLIAEGNFGMAGDVLDSLLKTSDTRIHIKSYWPLNKENLIENQKELEKSFVYIVFSHRNEFPFDWPMKELQKFEKPNKKNSLYLFELK